MAETERHSGARPARARHVGFAVLALIVLAGMWGCVRIVEGPPVPRADVRETIGRMQSTLQTAHDAARGESSDGVASGDGDAAADGADRSGAPAGAGAGVTAGDGGDDAQQEPETARLRVSPCYQTGMRAMGKQLEPGVYQFDATWSLPVAADDWAAVVRRVAEALEGEGWRQPQDGFRQEEHYVHLRSGDDEASVTAREHTPGPDSALELDRDDVAHDGPEDGESAGGGSSAGSDAASGGAQWFVSVEVRTDCARQDTPARTALPLLAAPTPEEVTWTETRW